MNLMVTKMAERKQRFADASKGINRTSSAEQLAQQVPGIRYTQES